MPLWIRRYNLRSGFLIRPLAIAPALGAAGAMLSWVEETFPGFSEWVPRALFPSHADPQDELRHLALMEGDASYVFAILLMTLTLASLQSSPRIIVSFARGELRAGPRHTMDPGRFARIN